MKRRTGLVVLGLVLLGLSASLFLKRPRRARPPGYEAPWAALSTVTQRDWAPDPTYREVVQAVFFEARAALEHCNEELYRRSEGAELEVELLMERTPEGMQLRFAHVPERPEAPRLATCIEQALESTAPAPAALPPGTRWRLSAIILLHPEDELPPIPWWHRFVPPSWRSGGDSAIHIGSRQQQVPRPGHRAAHRGDDPAGAGTPGGGHARHQA